MGDNELYTIEDWLNEHSINKWLNSTNYAANPIAEGPISNFKSAYANRVTNESSNLPQDVSQLIENISYRLSNCETKYRDICRKYSDMYERYKILCHRLDQSVELNTLLADKIKTLAKLRNTKSEQRQIAKEIAELFNEPSLF